MHTNSLPNPYLGRISQQQYFSRLRVDNRIASQNANTGTQYYPHDGSHGISAYAVSRHPTARPLEMQPKYALVNHNQAQNNLYLTANQQRSAQTVAIPQHFVNPVSLIVTPPAYTNIGDPRNTTPSPIQIMYPSPVRGPAAGQGPVTSDPSTTRSVNPSFITFRSCGATRYRCECLYETSRKSDLDRHHDGTKHAGKRHHCSVPNCTKSYTRKYELEKHKRRH